MDNTADDGGPAFPVPRFRTLVNTERGTAQSVAAGTDPGMSLRDWFAGQALCGIVMGSSWSSDALLTAAVGAAYDAADAMLAERAKETKRA